MYMGNTSPVEAQNKLANDIGSLVESFKTDNPTVTIENLSYGFW
jgi:hypothetical protein